MRLRCGLSLRFLGALTFLAEGRPCPKNFVYALLQSAMLDVRPIPHTRAVDSNWWLCRTLRKLISLHVSLKADRKHSTLLDGAFFNNLAHYIWKNASDLHENFYHRSNFGQPLNFGNQPDLKSEYGPDSPWQRSTFSKCSCISFISYYL